METRMGGNGTMGYGMGEWKFRNRNMGYVEWVNGSFGTEPWGYAEWKFWNGTRGYVEWANGSFGTEPWGYAEWVNVEVSERKHGGMYGVHM